MRFGNWRGVAIAFAFATAIAATNAGSARADLHTIPREVEAVDVNTGGPYMAPPVPYGHYAKDCGHVSKAIGCLTSPFSTLSGLLHGGCGAGGCGAGGCNNGGDPGCGFCGGSGCGFCHGKGLLHKLGNGRGNKLCGRGGAGGTFCGATGGGATICGPAGCPIDPMPIVQPTAQAPIASSQVICTEQGCHLRARHFHRRGRGCNQCGGNGCGICQGDPSLLSGTLCGSCHGAGCGLCGGKGLFGGGAGHGCGACGGAGCRLCLGPKALLGLPSAIIGKICHRGEVKYFIGPGGPVPITPGYVPYVVTTRSPRDFFAFPPFNDSVP